MIKNTHCKDREKNEYFIKQCKGTFQVENSGDLRRIFPKINDFVGDGEGESMRRDLTRLGLGDAFWPGKRRMTT